MFWNCSKKVERESSFREMSDFYHEDCIGLRTMKMEGKKMSSDDNVIETVLKIVTVVASIAVAVIEGVDSLKDKKGEEYK